MFDFGLIFISSHFISDMKLQTLLIMFKKMTSLILHGMPTSFESQKSIWSLINSLSSLRQLHLFAMNHVTIPARLKIFNQLEQFSLTDYGHGDIVPVLSQLGPDCKILLLDSVMCNAEKLQKVLGTNLQLSKSLRSLFLGNTAVPGPRLQMLDIVHDFWFGNLPPPPLPPIAPEPDAQINNPLHILRFASANLKSIKYLDVTFMLANSNDPVSYTVVL